MPTPTHGHFDALIWKFVDSQPQLNHWESPAQILSESPQATAMSHELKQLGFKFVGPKCCYSLMQSCGLVIDHPKGTPEWEAAFQRLAGRASSANSAGTHAKQGKREFCHELVGVSQEEAKLKLLLGDHCRPSVSVGWVTTLHGRRWGWYHVSAAVYRV